MADNVPQNGTSTVAADEVTYSGDTTKVQIVQAAFVGGSEGSRTIDKVPGDATNGLDVDITRNGPPQVAVVKTTITRPSDSNAYAANDCFSSSTSTPTSGGSTITNAARVSGGGGTITGMIAVMSAGSAFNGEVWIFDQAATNTNDNAALSVTDADMLNLVAVIPFNTIDVTAVNAMSYVNCEEDFVCVGTANLRYLVKVMSAFTPASAEVLSLLFKIRN